MRPSNKRLRAQRELRPIPDQRQKLGSFLRRWLDDVARPTLRAWTYDSYDDILRLHLEPGLGRIPLARLAPADVQWFLNTKLESGLSPRRVQYLHAVLRRALVTAERWGLVSRNVAKLVDPPRVPRHEIRPLTPAEARLLLDASADDRLRTLWLTALGTGLRQGELLALRREDVDLDGGRLHVRSTLARVDGKLVRLEPKTSRSRRTVHLPATVIAALRAHRTRQRMERLVAGHGGSTPATSSRRPSARPSRQPGSPGRSTLRWRGPAYRGAASTISATPLPPSCWLRASGSRMSRTCSGTAPSC